MRRWIYYLTAFLCCSAISCAPNPDDITLQGSGATFPAPIYKRWFLEFYQQNPDVRVNYQAIGSGAGVRQFSEGLTDFGASDSAMSDKEMKSALDERPPTEGVLLVPMTAGSVALGYNVPGIPRDQELRLSREVLIDILFGRIDNWNDPAIAKFNPKLTLPDLPITWVRRSDGSGTTYALTNHLAAMSEEWKQKVGVNKSVPWPVGIGGKGNPGVAAIVSQTPGALGYVEYGYALLSNLPMASVENKAGAFVAPSLKSNQAALAEGKMPDNFRLFIADPAGAGAYPIVTYTWILVPKRYSYPGDPEREKKVARTVRKVLRYCLTDGQKFSDDLGYTPLPANVVGPILEAVEKIEPRE
jgi:phosphate transport system substrate-binding protein